MRQVLLVDDEYLVRERLKRGVDWAAAGFEVAAEAENGEDAIALLATARFDLAIVDINMPLLDGLAFAQLASVRHPTLKIVILTGYGTFEYAKAALRAGARDYLLKPIDKREFEDLLKRMAGELREADADRESRERERRQAEESRSLRREKWIMRRLQGMEPHEREQASLYLPALDDGNYAVIVVALDHDGDEESAGTAGIPEPAGREGADAWREALLGAGLSRMPGLEWAGGADGRTVYIVANVPNDGGRALTEALNDGLAACLAHAGKAASAGISRIRADWRELAEAAAEAAAALDCRSLAGGGRSFGWPDVASRSGSANLPSVRESLLVQLRLGSGDAARAAIDGWLASCAAPDAPIARLHLLVVEIAAALRIHASDCGLAAGELLPETLLPQMLVRELATPARIRRWLLDRTSLVLDAAAASRKTSPALLAEEAAAYIDSAYADPELDLGRIAARISVHPSYLSRLFKPATGYSVVEYLTMRRLRRAEQLLADGVRNLAYVSEAVGFADPQYFSKCFKKEYGIPPSQYGGVRRP